jgi:hypothetical protein
VVCTNSVKTLGGVLIIELCGHGELSFCELGWHSFVLTYVQLQMSQKRSGSGDRLLAQVDGYPRQTKWRNSALAWDLSVSSDCAVFRAVSATIALPVAAMAATAALTFFVLVTPAAEV